MPRKTQQHGGAAAGRGQASMRPRPDAAENVIDPRASIPDFSRFNEAAARCRGKLVRHLRVGELIRHASMRPRPDAAENARTALRAGRGPRRFNEAAARCRGKRAHSAAPGPRPHCFNEAAARCRGKPRGTPTPMQQTVAASMRPRPDAAENVCGLERGHAGDHASMRPRPDAAENQDVAAAHSRAIRLQ